MSLCRHVKPRTPDHEGAGTRPPTAVLLLREPQSLDTRQAIRYDSSAKEE